MTEAEWRAQPGPWAHLTKEQTDELIAAAVNAEREACSNYLDAKADAYDGDVWWMPGYLRELALELRSRSNL